MSTNNTQSSHSPLESLCIDTTIMINEAVMKLFHPDKYEASRKVAVAATTAIEDEDEDEEEEEEGKQIHHTTHPNQYSSKRRKFKRLRKTANLSIDIWKLSPELTPNYSIMPKQQFKNLLCQASPGYRQQLQQHLSNRKLLSFVQKYAHLMSMRFQLEMEKDYWKHVVNGLSSAVKWLSQMPKGLTRRYSINWDYPRTERNIRHRQRLTANELNQICQQVRVHSPHYLSCWSISDKTLIDQRMRMICDALKVMIENDLQKLHTRFEQKKNLIQNDAYDIHLLKSFYVLHPTEDQKVIAEKIWRTKCRSGQRRIHEIKTNSFNNKQADTSSIVNGNNQHYINHDHQQYQISFLQSFDLTMRTIIETRLANLENRTQKIISFQNISSSTQS